MFYCGADRDRDQEPFLRAFFTAQLGSNCDGVLYQAQYAGSNCDGVLYQAQYAGSNCDGVLYQAQYAGVVTFGPFYISENNVMVMMPAAIQPPSIVDGVVYHPR